MRTAASLQRISVEEARKIMARGDVLVLDVRDEASFAGGHIEGARCVAGVDIDRLIATAPRIRPVLVYCYHGNASQIVGQMFVDFGFRDVMSLDGGYEGWREVMDEAAAAGAPAHGHGPGPGTGQGP